MARKHKAPTKASVRRILLQGLGASAGTTARKNDWSDEAMERLSEMKLQATYVATGNPRHETRNDCTMARKYKAQTEATVRRIPLQGIGASARATSTTPRKNDWSDWSDNAKHIYRQHIKLLVTRDARPKTRDFLLFTLRSMLLV
jgi:hypothetical protein